MKLLRSKQPDPIDPALAQRLGAIAGRGRSEASFYEKRFEAARVATDQ